MNKKKLSGMTYQEKKDLYLKYSGIMFSMMRLSSRYISANKWDDSFHITGGYGITLTALSCGLRELTENKVTGTVRTHP